MEEIPQEIIDSIEFAQHSETAWAIHCIDTDDGTDFMLLGIIEVGPNINGEIKYRVVCTRASADFNTLDDAKTFVYGMYND